MIVIDLTAKNGTMAEVGFDPKVHGIPEIGKVIYARCVVSTYRDDDQLQLDAYIG